MTDLGEQFWEERYQNNQIGWDLGAVSPPLKSYFDQLVDQNLKILIPGAGSGYEANYLWESGFKNVHFLDLSQSAHERLVSQCPDFPIEQMHKQNFFDHSGNYDLIVEQTFFCALNPDLRNAYVQQCFELLKTNGKISGLLFNRHFEKKGPPFGGDEQEYRLLFQNNFDLLIMESSYNSIGPRMGHELFFIAQRIK